MTLKEKLQDIFNRDYPGMDVFEKEVIAPVAGGEIEKINKDLTYDPRHRERARKAGIKKIEYVADIINMNSDDIALMDITIEDSVNIERTRVNIQSLVRSLVAENSHILMIFHYETPENRAWRFSYAYKQENLSNITSAKRFTYVFGKNFRGKTPSERFAELATSQHTDQDFINAFSVETLSDEFFDKYKELYLKFVKFITGKVYEKKKGKWQEVVYHAPSRYYYDSFNGDDKIVRDYVKKMFGRIVFMYFLQRKEWLNYNPRFMSDLFKNSNNKDNFLDGVLEPLFFGLLNTHPNERTDKVKEIVGTDNIPYLNGGLFQNDELDDKECVFPAGYFEDLFDFFDQYNFTIDENDPEDSEVGIDPEMLGRIFENLLEDNKDKGAYYTPKEIVEYMCRESMISYLQEEGYSADGKKLIRKFVETLSNEGLTDRQRNHLRIKLKEVKICDPAIGSGAFPMGLVNLLTKLYGAIGIKAKDGEIKRHILENNIYGVDIEKGAVDIARLRFWLAMVVEDDTKNIKEVAPLPNLNYRIMQGNSLVERFGGVNLEELLGKPKDEFEFVYDDEGFRKNLESKLQDFYNADEHERRSSLTDEIDELIIGRLHKLNENLTLANIKPSENDQFFLWHTWFSDVFKTGGFDIVIGNPPYGAKLSKADQELLKDIYYTAKTIKGVQKASLDTYTMFIEQSYKLLKKGGAFAMIVPISLTSSDSLAGVHRILKLRCNDVRISSYAVRPQPVFKNAVVNTSILLFKKTGKKCDSLKSTKMYRKGKNFDLRYLVDHLEYIDVSEHLLYGRIPKISYQIEIDILDKLKKHPQLGLEFQNNGSPIYYRTTGGRYFKVVTNYSTGSTKEKPIYFDSLKASAIGCILSSNLSFWFYQIYSNNLDWKSFEIANFRIPNLSMEQIGYLSKLYEEYLSDIEKNANVRESTGESSYKVSTFKEYKIGKSKAIIDKIDDFIGPIYGLSPQEIDFIKNYEIEFRLSDEE